VEQKRIQDAGWKGCDPQPVSAIVLINPPCLPLGPVPQNQEGGMMAPCFRKLNSNPPVCGVHNVALVQRNLSIDWNAPRLGQLTAYVCPVSGQVVPDEVRREQG
jgi:hypothetical protein